MARNMVTRAFTAPTLRAFWRYWNAGFNFYLLYYCYHPLRRSLGHGLSLLVTFAVCGVAHDIVIVLPLALVHDARTPFPFVTCWFLLVGAGVLAGDRWKLSFNGLPSGLRVGAHVAFLATTFAITWTFAGYW